jgi:hypothetical protein
MLKATVSGAMRKLGYTFARGDLRAELDALRAELAGRDAAIVATQDQLAATQAELTGAKAELAEHTTGNGTLRDQLASALRDRAGYKNAYETVQAELGQARQDRDGYKGAYDTVCTQLSDMNVVLRQNKIDPVIVKEAALPDPPVQKRIGDSPAALAAVQAEIERQKLPKELAEIFLDPSFSFEDRSKYMRLSQVTNPPLWANAAATVASLVNAQYLKYTPRSNDPAKAKENAETLRREGVLPLGQPFTPKQVAEIQDYFLKRPIFNGHIPMSARHRVLRRYVNYTAENYPIGCYSAQEIALAPHLIEFALSPAVLDTAAAYFGCIPRLTWLQSWWNFAGPGDYPHRQNFYHRDSNDFGMFWVYIYLTDVDAGSGPHKVLRRSGDFAVVRERLERAKADPVIGPKVKDITLDDLNGLGHGIADDVKELIFDGLEDVMTGPAGTAFVTRGIDYHKVMTPLIKKRQIYAARFCINEFNYPGPDRDGDPVPSEVVAERVGSDEQLRYISGLRFDWSNWK